MWYMFLILSYLCNSDADRLETFVLLTQFCQSVAS